MPITPGTRDRLTSGVVRVIRSGRHLSVRAADVLHGDLPSSGWALLVPLTGEGVRALVVTRAPWAAAALADRDEDDARLLSGLSERLATDLDRAPAVVHPAAA